MTTPEHATSPSRRLDGAALCVIVGVLALTLLVLLAGAWRETEALLPRVIVDDTFYYFLPAWNAVRGQGLSFDGIHATNGFHPLWMALLLPLAALAPDRELLTHMALTLCAFSATAAVAVLTAFCWRLGGRAAAMTCALLGSGFLLFGATRWITLNGLESALFLFTAALAAAAGERCLRADGARQHALLWGAALGLVALSRLEYTLPCLALLAVVWAVARHARHGYALAAYLALLTPYTLWNLVTFHSLTTVSALVKRYQSDYYIRHRLGGYSSPRYTAYVQEQLQRCLEHVTEHVFASGHWAAVALVTALLLAAGIGAALSRGPARRPLLILAVVALLAGAHLLAVTLLLPLFVPGNTWHLVGEYFLLLLLAPLGLAALRRCPRVAPRAYLALSAVAVILAGALWLARRHEAAAYFRSYAPSDSESGPNCYTMSLWMREHLPADALLGSWNCGTLAYISERATVNLDGLINNYEKLRWITERRDIMEYIRRKRIDYVVDYFSGQAYAEGRIRRGGLPLPLHESECVYRRRPNAVYDLILFDLRRPGRAAMPPSGMTVAAPPADAVHTAAPWIDGATLEAQRVVPAQAAPGERVRVEWFVRAAAETGAASATVTLTARGGRRVRDYDYLLPLSLADWPRDACLRLEFNFRLPYELAPGDYSLGLGDEAATAARFAVIARDAASLRTREKVRLALLRLIRW